MAKKPMYLGHVNLYVLVCRAFEGLVRRTCWASTPMSIGRAGRRSCRPTSTVA